MLSWNLATNFIKYKYSIYFGTLILALYCCCRDDVKYGLFSKNFFQRRQQYGGCKNLKVTTSFQKKKRFSVMISDKKHW